MGQVLRDKWIEIDVDAVKNNLRAVKTLLDDRARLIAVVKANAYGHGAEEIARVLFQNGVDFFAVSFYYEGMQLRNAGIRSNVLVFSPVGNEDDAMDSVRNNLTLTINSCNDIELLDRVGLSLKKQVRVHLKIDTGLGRFGLNEKEAVQACKEISQSDYLFVEGIYTHIADPASPDYTVRQFEKFMQLINCLEREGFIIPVKHFANSSIFLNYPDMYLNAVRIGTLLSGQHPVGDFPVRIDLQDPYKFKSRIISLKSMEKGSTLGYYRTYKLKRAAQIAVIPVGFQDGLAVEVANKPVGFVDMLKKVTKYILSYFNMSRFNLYVSINGREYPIRGKVFMQMALVEIPVEVVVNVGDEVEVPVRKTLASRSIARLYVQEGKAGKIAYDENTNYIVDEA